MERTIPVHPLHERQHGEPKASCMAPAAICLRHPHLEVRVRPQEHDIFWCTADAGWITGHSYLVYGPLSNGTTSLMFEGVPNFPKPDPFLGDVEKFGVNILYTAPTAVRFAIDSIASPFVDKSHNHN